jgi:5-methylthioadenosine/S-adenosylhomocysteine deaminase
MNNEFILTDATVFTMDASRTTYRNGYVWVRDGAIHAVGPMSELNADATPPRRSLGRSHAIMPGVVNPHDHLEGSVVRGSQDDLPMMRRRAAQGVLWETRRSMDAAAYEAATALTLLDLATQGVTTTTANLISEHDPASSDAVLSAVARSGTRVFFSPAAMDDPSGEWVPSDFCNTAAEAIAEVERLTEAWRSDLIEIAPEAIHDLYCSEAMIRELHAYAADAGTRFMMHLGTKELEVELAQRRYGRRSVEELDRIGCLTGKTVLAHANRVNTTEIELLAASGTGVAVCPIPAAWGGSQIAPLAEMLEHGIRVGFGLDGPETNNSQNPWETAKMAILTQRLWPEYSSFGSAELALELLTIGGARALHIEDSIGSLELGKRADLICIDLDRPALVPRASVITNLIYSPDPGAVRHVFVDGRELVSNGQHLTLDAEAVIETAFRESARIHRAAGMEQVIKERTRWRWVED